MTGKVLVGGVVAAGAVILGVAGFALVSSDREGSADAVQLSTTVDGGSTDAAPERTPAADESAAGTSGSDGTADASGGDSDGAAQDAGSVDTVPAGITSERAQEIAVAAQPGTVDWMELTTDYGRTVWYVEVVSPEGVEWDVYVDATTGEVVEVEQD